MLWWASKMHMVCSSLSSVIMLPLKVSRLTLGRKIIELEYNDDTGKVAVQWRNNPFTMNESGDYDYAVVGGQTPGVAQELLALVVRHLNHELPVVL